MANQDSISQADQAAGSATGVKPANSGAQATHQAALDAGHFLIQHCAGCRKHVYFPRESCPHCGASELRWIVPTGMGTVYATTVVRRNPDAGGDYNVSLIDLDEGVRMMSRVGNGEFAQIQIGLRVRARVQITEGHGLVVFETVPACDAGAIAP